MNKNSKHRNEFIHLYNPKKEGLGSYDVNYINACNKVKRSHNKVNKKDTERYAA